MAKQRILIVDDEEDICMILSYSLQKAGYETLVAHSAEEALELLQSPIANSPSPISLILLDIMMDGMSGLEMAEKLRSDIGRSHSELSDASLLAIGRSPCSLWADFLARISKITRITIPRRTNNINGIILLHIFFYD